MILFLTQLFFLRKLFYFWAYVIPHLLFSRQFPTERNSIFSVECKTVSQPPIHWPCPSSILCNHHVDYGNNLCSPWLWSWPTPIQNASSPRQIWSSPTAWYFANPSLKTLPLVAFSLVKAQAFHRGWLTLPSESDLCFSDFPCTSSLALPVLALKEHRCCLALDLTHLFFFLTCFHPSSNWLSLIPQASAFQELSWFLE